MKTKHVVLGTGPLGLAIIDELLSQGKQIIAVNRSQIKEQLPVEVQFIQCDVTNIDELQAIFKDAIVAYHCIGAAYSQWEIALPKVMNAIIYAAAKQQTKIVYADNLYAYGPQSEALAEHMPYNPIGHKTAMRAEMARLLIDANHTGLIQATIGRGSDFFGPRVKHSILGERVFHYLLTNKPVELIGNPKMKHAHLYIKDFARGLVILGTSDTAYGQTWHIPHLPAQSTFEIVEQIGVQLNIVPKYRIASPFIVKTLGLVNPSMRQFNELLYQTTQSFTVDNNKFNDYFSFTSTPHHLAIKETIDWYKKHY